MVTAAALNLIAWALAVSAIVDATLGGSLAGPLLLAAIVAWIPGVVAFVRWYGAQSRMLAGITETPVNTRSLVRLLFLPLPLGGLASTYTFAVQVALARDMRDITGPDPAVLAAAMLLVPPVGWLVAQREMERIAAAPVPA